MPLVKQKIIVFSEYGELCDIALSLQDQGHEVLLHIPSHDYKNIGKGLVPHIDNWYQYLGKGYLWIFDSCSFGELQDWMRSRGELIFGGSAMGDKLENERQAAQKWFKQAGFLQPESKNFKNIDQAIAYVAKNKNKKFVLKQNSDAPKFINTIGRFDDNEDMIFHLTELKKYWNRQEWGEFDCDLMEKVEGLEVAVSAFFNGQNFLKNKTGKVVAFINFEHKKMANDDLGQTTGELGTLFIGTTEDNPIVKEVLMKPEIIRVLREAKFRGVFDINGSKTKKGYVAFEPTMRPGIPASSYEFIEGLKTPFGEVARIVASGEDKPIEIVEGIGMVMVVAAKPFPIEVDLDKEATSQGEKLWILKDGKPVSEFDAEQKKRIHLFNFEKVTDEDTGEKRLSVATKNGYLLTVTNTGKNITEVREKIIEYIKNNIFLNDMFYRTDIGKRVEDYAGIKSGIDKSFILENSKNQYEIKKNQYEEKLKEFNTRLEDLQNMYEKLLTVERNKQEETVKEYEEKLRNEIKKGEEEVNKIKQLMKEAIYNE